MLLEKEELYLHPEDENWGSIDSPKLAKLAELLSQEICQDLKTRSRNLVPGLRSALRFLAEVEEGLR